MIIGVAVRFNELTVCLPKPSRHADCINHAVQALGLKPENIDDSDYGFYSKTGFFFDRGEAAAIAREANQLPRDTKIKKLTSQDLW